MRRIQRLLPAGITSLVLVFLVSRGLGFIRELGLAFYFGTSAEADRFAAAFIVAGVATLLVGETFYASSVRVFGALGVEKRTSAAESLMSTATRVGVIVTVAFAVVGPLLSVVVVQPGRDELTRLMAITIALAPSVGAAVPIAICNARLTLERRIALQIGAQALWSAGAIAGVAAIAVMGKGLGTIPIALGWSLGNIVSAIILREATKEGQRGAGGAAPGLRKILAIGTPVAIAYSFTVVQELTDRIVAHQLGTGNLAALSYANRFVLLPIGIVIGALGPLVLATFSLGSRDPESVRKSVPEMRRMVNALVAIGLLFALLGPALAEVTFQRGEFDKQSLELVQSALTGFAIGVPGVGFSLLLFRVMQAVAPLRSLVAVALAAASLNVVVSIPLAIHLGILGVSLGTSVVGYATCILQLRMLRFLGEYWTEKITRMFAGGICCSGLAIAGLLLAIG